MARTPRTWQAPGSDTRLTLDDMALLACGGENAAWASKVLAKEDDKTLDELLGDDEMLPRGVLAAVDSDEDEDICVGLLSAAGQVWFGDGWQQPTDEHDLTNTVDLDESDVAFVARAFLEGSSAVLLRPYLPMAVIAAPTDTSMQEAPSDLPADAVTVAVVDPMDKTAVLELLAVAPGPTVYRRNDGNWFEDAGWVPVLKAIHPPPLVKLDQGQVASVASQVDDSTKGVKFAPLSQHDRALYQPAVQSSAYLRQLAAESDDVAIALNMALVAVAGRELSPKDVASTERLKRYWTTGPGALKIRWGQPGSHSRCVRHLSKYVGPLIVHGLCQNLGKRLGGYGVADHVGTNAKHRIERALKP